MYGHIQKLAEAEKEGLKKAGIEADLYQIPETLPQEVLTKVRRPKRRLLVLEYRLSRYLYLLYACLLQVVIIYTYIVLSYLDARTSKVRYPSRRRRHP